MSRMSAPTRAKSVEAGLWERADGTIIRLREMPDGHLVNALLKHIADGYRHDGLGYTFDQHRVILDALTREVVRRNLQDYALAEAAKRDGRT